jgi:hypothetical protein
LLTIEFEQVEDFSALLCLSESCEEPYALMHEDHPYEGVTRLMLPQIADQ